MFFESLVGPIRQNYKRDKQSVSVSMHDSSHINRLLTKNCKKCNYYTCHLETAHGDEVQ